MLVVFCGALFFITTFLFIHCTTFLVGLFFTVVHIKCATLLSWYNFAVVTCYFGVVSFFFTVAFLTLLSLHISVLLYVDLPTLFIWYFFASGL